MPSLTFEPAPKSGHPLRILCLGAHADDIEIGCGGTLLRLLETYAATQVDWVVFASNEGREAEARRAAEAMLSDAGSADVEVFAFEDGFLPYQGEAVKRCFEELKARCTPDLILTHFEGDRHQDHRLVNELTWNTFRDHAILEYEVPKFDGDLGNPSVFVPLSRETLDRKIEVLQTWYQSQRTKRWFDPDVFRSLCRIRGMECQSPSGYAEAFYARKLVLLGRT